MKAEIIKASNGEYRLESVGSDALSFLKGIGFDINSVLSFSFSEMCDVLNEYYLKRDAELVYLYTGNICGVYKIYSKTFPERCYIGSSKTMFLRWLHHVNKLKTGMNNRILQNHINEYGIDDLIFESIEECAVEHLLEREQFFIDNDPLNAYFCVYKKVDGRGHIVYNDTREKLKKANIGKPKTHKLSDEAIASIRRMLIGHVVSEETRSKIRKSLGSTIIQETPDGVFIKQWDSIKQITKETGFNRNRITKAVRMGDKGGVYNGFNWRYIDKK